MLGTQRHSDSDVWISLLSVLHYSLRSYLYLLTQCPGSGALGFTLSFLWLLVLLGDGSFSVFSMQDASSLEANGIPSARHSFWKMGTMFDTHDSRHTLGVGFYLTFSRPYKRFEIYQTTLKINGCIKKQFTWLLGLLCLSTDNTGDSDFPKEVLWSLYKGPNWCTTLQTTTALESVIWFWPACCGGISRDCSSWFVIHAFRWLKLLPNTSITVF